GQSPLVFTADGRTIVANTFAETKNLTKGIPLVQADAQAGQTQAILDVPVDGRDPGKDYSQFVLAASPTQPATVTVGLVDGRIMICPLEVDRGTPLKEVASLPLAPVPAQTLRDFGHLEFSDDGRFLIGLGSVNMLWDVAARKFLLSTKLSENRGTNAL